MTTGTVSVGAIVVGAIVVVTGSSVVVAVPGPATTVEAGGTSEPTGATSLPPRLSMPRGARSTPGSFDPRQDSTTTERRMLTSGVQGRR